jgi:hypothetical protein
MPLRPRSHPTLPFALVALLLAPGMAHSASAQHVSTLLLPRGAFLLEGAGSFSQVDARFGNGGRSPLGAGAFDVAIGEAGFPALADEGERIRALVGSANQPISAGRFVGRFEANEQRIPLRAGFGVLDRVSIGVTVPIVRRRVDAHLQVTGADANVGPNPLSSGAASEVNGFRSSAAAALSTLRAAVDAACAAEGESSGACVSGRSAESRVAGFLAELDEAWNELDLFPLSGSPLGAALAARWAEARADLGTWGAEGPPSVPMARMAGAQQLASYRERYSDPVWSADGFPHATPDMLYTVGDVEAHLVVGLFGHGGLAEDGAVREGLRVRSAVEASMRFATGEVDSFAVLVPAEGLSGHGGLGVRWVTDVLAGGRAGILVDASWQSFTTSEGVMRGVDPSNGWNPAAARVLAEGAPGDRFRLGVTPRFILAPGVSLGAGLDLVRTSDTEWRFRADPADAPGGADPDNTALSPGRVVPGWTSQRVSVELRFAGWDAPVVGGLPFPADLRIRALRSVAGSEGAPVDTRLEMGARILRRR